MFEIIGLIFATGLLFALAAIVGLISAFLVWLLVRERNLPRTTLTATAILLPIASAAYLWLCAAFLPGQTLFGDISQPLPNGYYLQALGKMPDFASISRAPLPNSSEVQLTECIGQLTVYGPLVAGRYSHPFGSFDADPDEPYFLFDTRSGKYSDLPDLNALERTLQHPVNLTKVELFHSREPTYVRQQRREHTIMFVAPILTIAIFFLIVLAWSRSVSAVPPTIYT